MAPPLPKNSSFPMTSSRQIVDSLTSHLSLYNSCLPNASLNSNPNPRSSIIKWFSSLSVTQRQAQLTVIDLKFTQTLLQMIRKIESNGHGFFFVLPDIPLDDAAGDGVGFLPSLLHRKSHGLLSRVAESNKSERLIREATRLFSSNEGENVKQIVLLGNDNCLDTMTVSEDFVENVEKFVEIMDGVSGGEFLKGEDNGGLAVEWVEMEWLKAKGYYSMEVFMANRLEVALRLAWLNSCNNGKKKGLRLKEKTHGVGLSINVFWRKKGCIDWWRNLDKETKGKLLRIVIGKAAKCLSMEVLKGENSKDRVRQWISKSEHCGNSAMLQISGAKDRCITKSKSDSRSFSSINSMFDSLIILQDISSMLLMLQHSVKDEEILFYSSVNTVTTPFDCVVRKFREFLMAISLDCTKVELLGDGNTKPTIEKKPEKHNTRKQKRKAKNSNLKKPTTPLTRSLEEESKVVKTSKENGVEFLDRKTVDTNLSGKLSDKAQEPLLPTDDKGICKTTVSKENGASSSRKGKRKKAKRASSQRPVEVGGQQTSGVSGVDLQSTCPKDEFEDEHSNVVSSSSKASENGEKPLISMLKEDCHVMDVPDNEAVANVESVEYCKDNGATSSTVSVEKFERVRKSGFKVEEKPFRIQEHQRTGLYDIGILNSPVYLSYEWPTVTPLQLPPSNSHLPAATDRLHLDVGHNMQKNPFHQPFVPGEHRVRNSSGENGCVSIVSRPLTMSSDWPLTVRSNFDSGFYPKRQTFQHGFSSPSVQRTAFTTDDLTEFCYYPKKSQPQEVLVEEHENHWMSEEELEMHAVSGMDYNQYFGGGVMYWNPSDYPAGTNFSRPPSRSSDDSSWAWREADMNRAVDDMVAFSSSYSTNGLTSPSTASFCSVFDPLGSAISSKVLDVKEDNALSVDGEVKTGESHPYPILRPIIVPSISKERSRSDIKRSHDHTSPCVQHPRIKRPPSPVVLCVPHAPRPPPPSPIKQRGFPTARSGSSSPRHWGVKGWSSDVISFEEACVYMDGSEVVWPSWRNKGLSVHQLTQPVPGSLLQDRLIAISQLARDQEHPDIALPLQPPESQISTRKASLSVIHSCLTEEINFFCKQVTTENIVRKPYISWAVKRVTRSLQVLWPRSRTNIFGSNATGLSLPSSDVDLVVCLPPVRNLEPIKEAGILEGRNGIKETCLQHAARCLANQEWVKNDSLKIVENTAIPIIMLVVEVPHELISAGSLNIRSSKEGSIQNSDEQRNSFGNDSNGPEISSPPHCFQMHSESGHDIKSVRIDISFKSPSHTGLQTTELVKDLTGQFPASTPLALVLKKFLADRSLDQSYSGGLSSYCLVLLVVRFLQHEHHLGRLINQNYGSLLMDFLYFFGNVFDPREMRVSVQGSGIYMKREPGCSIDPIYIADPLFPTNNVGRNCFRIHQCIKAFSDAYSILESELSFNSVDDEDDDLNTNLTCKLLPKIIPSIVHFPGS